MSDLRSPASAPEFFAPGRINLIGEHIDYSGGRVLPAALVQGTRVRVETPGAGNAIEVRSSREAQSVRIPLPAADSAKTGGWSDYVRAVACALEERGIPVAACALHIDSNLAVGAGLSSSASLEVAVAQALLHVAGPGPATQLPPMQLALTCQRAENQFVGARCGLMDQFAAVFGRRDHALLFDCQSLEYRPVALPAGAAWLLAASGVQHSIAGGEYNSRREQSEQLQEQARKVFGRFARLRDLTDAQINQLGADLSPLLRRRLRHITSENRRVLAAVTALEAAQLAQAGTLLNASHESLSADFQVSCPELDRLAELFRSLPGVYGARMMGGGFGGCVLALADPDAVEAIGNNLPPAYRQATGIRTDVMVCRIGDGAAQAALPPSDQSHRHQT